MCDNRRNKIKSFIIAPKVQLEFGVKVAIFLVSFSSIFLFFIISSVERHQKNFISILNDLDMTVSSDVFWGYDDYLLIIFSVLFLIIAISVALLSRTHKIYGPAVPIKKHLKDLQQGDFSARIKLREKDEFQELAVKLNKLAKSLEELEKKENIFNE